MTVARVEELIDRGIKLYMAGRVHEARDAFQGALDLDPGNAKARSYLVHIRETSPVIVPPPSAPAAPAAPAAPSRAAALPKLWNPDTAEEAQDRAEPAAPVGGNGPEPRAAAREPGGEEYAPSPWDEGPAAPATIQLESTADGLDLEAVSEKSDLRPLVPEGARPVGDPEAVPPRSDVEVWLAAAKELFSLGDFSGSLELIEKILQVDPDHGEARDYLRQNEATLVSMYESKLGSMSRVPRLAIKPEEVMWLNLDHRAGFLLAQIDGTVDFESLFALSGLPRLDTARILANLIADGVITS
jgi:tetratricopeptide (TPR) repeat protein